jgi:hypothetical protein
MIYLANDQNTKQLSPDQSLDTITKPFDAVCRETADGESPADRTGRMLYALMELYIDCEFLYEWFLTTSEKERVKLFYSWADTREFDRAVSIFNHHFSQAGFNSLNDRIRELLQSDYEENVIDFTQKIFPKFVRDVKSKFLHKYDFAKLYMNKHLQEGVWSNLRITSDTCYKACGLFFFDYIDGNIYLTDQFQQPQRLIEDKRGFFLSAANECLDNYVKLASIAEEVKDTHDDLKNGTEKILSSISKVNENVIRQGTEIKEAISKNPPAGSGDTKDFGFFTELRQNQHFKNLCTGNPKTEACFKYLFDNSILKYNPKKGIIERIDFPSYAVTHLYYDQTFGYAGLEKRYRVDFLRLFGFDELPKNQEHGGTYVKWDDLVPQLLKAAGKVC